MEMFFLQEVVYLIHINTTIQMENNVPETGHSININNFKKAIDICTGYGVAYAPSNSNINITNMTAQWVFAKNFQQTMHDAVQQSKIPVTEREILFKTLSKKITQITGIVGSLNIESTFKSDVKILADRIRGYKYPIKDLTGDEQASAKVNSNHMSYVTRTGNYKLLIDLLATSPPYSPNESDLKLESLYTHHALMNSINQQIEAILTPVNEARAARNEILYNEVTGVLTLMKACKSYVKGLYGAGSDEYKLLRGIKFRVLPRK